MIFGKDRSYKFPDRLALVCFVPVTDIRYTRCSTITRKGLFQTLSASLTSSLRVSVDVVQIQGIDTPVCLLQYMAGRVSLAEPAH